MDANQKIAEARRLNEAGQHEAALQLIGPKISEKAPKDLAREWAAAIMELDKPDLDTIELVLMTLQDWANDEPSNPRANYYMSLALFNVGDAEGSEAFASLNFDKQPYYPSAILCANAQVVQGKVKEAADTLKRAADRISKPSEKHALLSRHFLFSEKYEEAAASAQRSLAEDPNNLISLLTLSESNYELGQPLPGLKYLQQAVDAHPHNRNVRSKLILQHLIDKRPPAALDVLLNSPNNEDERHDMLLDLGEELTQEGMTDAALLAYQLAVERYPDSYFAINGYGSTLQFLERDEEALQVFQRAIDLEPDLPHAWVGTGLALYDLERDLDAIQALKHAIGILDNDTDPEDVTENETLRAEALYGMALIHYDMGQEKEAIALMESVLDLYPDHPDAAHVLAEWQSGDGF